MIRLTFLFLLLLHTLTTQAQLRRGDQFITFGGGTSSALRVMDLPLASDLLGLGRWGKPAALSVAISPTYSTLATDWLEVGLSVSAVRAGGGGSTTLAINPAARAYFTNSAGGSLFVGASVLYLNSTLLPTRSQVAFVPSLGASLSAGSSVRAVPEIALLSFADTPNQLSISLAVQFLLNGPRDTTASVFRFEKGSVMLGSSVSGLSTELRQNGGLALSLTPEVHYFISESAALGFRGKYSRSRRPHSRNRARAADYTLAGGLSLRLLPKNTGRFIPFLQFGANYNRTNQYDDSSIYGRYGTVRSYVSYDIALGALIFLRPGIALETGFTFTTTGRSAYAVLPSDDNVLGFTLGGRFLL
ncbi:hypothetical protein LEM8419_01008 [Neolewinella maritima]|uniref:Porin n=1 Tax=Neolewinella maritima TaxID=1383882 RepID=A0ABM9AYA2_9BACT|nr:hypothetical protein [Neolewinella maritima]CAH0999708.1 hypothetical protein LEM8419_01008 [Neolewinella maritima]